MKKKAIVIGVMLLLGASVLATTVSAQENRYYWSDNFDSYETGSLLGGQGGWFPWDNDPGVNANVTNVQSHSPDNSVEIYGTRDMVHQFENVNYGNCTFRVWSYVPSSFEGVNYVILLSLYNAGASKWSVQIGFNSATFMLESYETGNSTPYLIDEWGEIRVEIDFVADRCEIYYNDALFVSQPWSQGGYLALDAVDLYGDSGSAVYYDDISVWAQDAPANPELEIGEVTGGFGLKSSVKNTGDGNATNVAWNISLDGKLVFLGKASTGTFTTLVAGAEEPIKASFILGFGKTNIVISASCDEGKTAEVTKTAFILGPFVLAVK